MTGPKEYETNKTERSKEVKVKVRRITEDPDGTTKETTVKVHDSSTILVPDFSNWKTWAFMLCLWATILLWHGADQIIEISLTNL